MTVQGREHVFAGYGSSRSTAFVVERQVTGVLLSYMGHMANGG